MSERGRKDGRRASGGGLAARRAVVRWSWRLFRREWRQQVLVLVLITVAVAVTVAAASAAYNMAPSGQAGFGTASHRLTVEASDRDELAVEVDAIEGWFATTEQIRTEFATVPGSAEDVLVRAQDPSGPFGSRCSTCAPASTRPPTTRSRSPTSWPRRTASTSATASSSVTARGPWSGSSRTPRTSATSSPWWRRRRR